MSELTDAKIDELLDELDNYASDRRAIVRAWLPAQTCPKRVRMLTSYGYRLQAGGVYKVDCMYVFPSGSIAYDVITELPNVVTVSVHHCEPVSDEA